MNNANDGDHHSGKAAAGHTHQERSSGRTDPRILMEASVKRKTHTILRYRTFCALAHSLISGWYASTTVEALALVAFRVRKSAVHAVVT